jgi:SAM-dependent methyltransferase
VFFDDYPRFHETSQVAASAARLNLRHEAIIGANRDIFPGARVLDLACNDGRWSFAALKSGASQVLGIEARPELCATASQTMKHYGMDPDVYQFVCGDVVEVLRESAFDADVVLCLGYMYHTYRHAELLHQIRRLEPKYLILDTNVLRGETRPLLEVKTERPFRQGAAALDPYSHDGQTLVMVPSLPAVVKLINTYEFGVEEMYDWPKLLAMHGRTPGVRKYAQGRRVTLRCRLGVPNNASLPPAPPSVADPVPCTDEKAAGLTAVAYEPRPRWREVVNQALSQTLGYHLTRSRQ